jgi:hypothetical protein
LSIWLFGKRFTDSPAKITVAVLAFAVMAAGVTVLTRTAPQDLTRRNQPACDGRRRPALAPRREARQASPDDDLESITDGSHC